MLHVVLLCCVVFSCVNGTRQTINFQTEPLAHMDVIKEKQPGLPVMVMVCIFTNFLCSVHNLHLFCLSVFIYLFISYLFICFFFSFIYVFFFCVCVCVQEFWVGWFDHWTESHAMVAGHEVRLVFVDSFSFLLWWLSFPYLFLCRSPASSRRLFTLALILISTCSMVCMKCVQTPFLLLFFQFICAFFFFFEYNRRNKLWVYERCQLRKEIRPNRHKVLLSLCLLFSIRPLTHHTSTQL